MHFLCIPSASITFHCISLERAAALLFGYSSYRKFLFNSSFLPLFNVTLSFLFLFALCLESNETNGWNSFSGDEDNRKCVHMWMKCGGFWLGEKWGKQSLVLRPTLSFAFITTADGDERNEKISRKIISLCRTIYHFTVCGSILFRCSAALFLLSFLLSRPCLTFNINLFSFRGFSLIFLPLRHYFLSQMVVFYRDAWAARSADNFSSNKLFSLIKIFQQNWRVSLNRSRKMKKRTKLIFNKSAPELSLFA